MIDLRLSGGLRTMGLSIRFGVLAAAVAVSTVAATGVSNAADMAGGGKIAVAPGVQLALVCDNGRTYPIRPRAVSDAGELVTGYIFTAPRKSHPFRLVPMGSGYRYAGAGFWFDGVRGEATLTVSDRETACTVDYGQS
jgi:hypothetical protein